MKPLLILGILCLVTTGCKEAPVTVKLADTISLKDIPEASWDRLSARKIFFAHQSIGFNIIDGVQDIMKEDSRIQLNIAKTNQPQDFDRPIFAHSTVGNNEDPQSKISAFMELMDNGLRSRVDIAFFKFCYVDINSATAVDVLFDNYRKTITALQNKYPETTFIHLTAPLTTLQGGIKGLVKRVLGKPIGIEDNVKREQFNDKLRKAFGEQGTLFDLAKAESTSPTGEIAAFINNGETCLQLNPAYTDDGGHLNETGRKQVAEQFLLHLVTVSDKLLSRSHP